MSKNDIEAKRTYYREWRRNNKDKINARHRERMATDPEYRQNLREYHRAWRTRKGKAYVRNVNLKTAHGITLAEYEALAQKQLNRCAVCGGQCWMRNKRIPLYVDHCHKSGKVRGLLCKECNTALGMLQDDWRIAERATAYLKRFRP